MRFRSHRFVLSVFCLTVALPVLIGNEATAQLCPDYALPPDGPDPDTLSIPAALDSVQACRLTTRSAQKAARLAGQSGNPAYVPQLKQIAADYATISRSVTFNALHALWLLDEPQSYFLQNAQDYESSKWLAYYSIWTMAREPDSTTAAALQPISENSNDGHLQSAVDAYKEVLRFRKAYEGRASVFPLDFKVLTMINLLMEGYNFNWIDSGYLAVSPGSPKRYLHPEVIWARKKLAEVADQYPGEVARVIAGFSNDTRLDPVQSDYYQDLSSTERQRLLDGTEFQTGFRAYLENAAFPDEPVPPPAEDPPAPLFPGALTVASEQAAASLGDSARVNGWNHTLGGQVVPVGELTHGLFTTTEAAQQAILDSLNAAQGTPVVVGVNPLPDVAQGALPFDPAALVDTALAGPGVRYISYNQPVDTLGSVGDPVVAYAPQGVPRVRPSDPAPPFSPLTGAGVLIINGGSYRPVEWTGLVILRGVPGTDPDDVTPPDPPYPGPLPGLPAGLDVIGGVLLHNNLDADYPVNVSLQGRVKIRYSRAALELLSDLGLPPATSVPPPK